jgi:hypothetical protein
VLRLDESRPHCGSMTNVTAFPSKFQVLRLDESRPHCGVTVCHRAGHARAEELVLRLDESRPHCGVCPPKLDPESRAMVLRLDESRPHCG